MDTDYKTYRFCSSCLTPLGRMLMASDGVALTGLWFEGQQHIPQDLAAAARDDRRPLFLSVRRWLEVYFTGLEPPYRLPLAPSGTPFQHRVWGIVAAIPYRATTSYGQIARRIASEDGVPSPSPRAVGMAVAHNPIALIVPCHRVLSADGGLRGYAAGIDRKRLLLALEQGYRLTAANRTILHSYKPKTSES